MYVFNFFVIYKLLNLFSLIWVSFLRLKFSTVEVNMCHLFITFVIHDLQKRVDSCLVTDV